MLFQKEIEKKVELNVIDHAAQLDEMRSLFGSRAEEILAAETEMQLEFDTFCDEADGGEGAQIWPCLPLNMKFD
jgi:hypothetical protein